MKLTKSLSFTKDGNIEEMERMFQQMAEGLKTWKEGVHSNWKLYCSSYKNYITFNVSCDLHEGKIDDTL